MMKLILIKHHKTLMYGVEMILEALKDYTFEARAGEFPPKDNFYEMEEED